MSAGLAMLRTLHEQPEIFASLEKKTAYLHEGITGVLEAHGIAHQINREGSMISVHFTEEAVVDFDTAKAGDNEVFKRYFHGMLQQGIYLPPSAFESYFLNDALTYDDLDATIAALDSIAPDLK
jgi:glutamate-1-semialdehyde 2,1-aminomutase